MSGTVDAYLRDEVDPILRPLIDLLVKDRPHGTESICDAIARFALEARDRSRAPTLEGLREKFTAAGQGHVFKYADEGKLDGDQKGLLAAQLSKLDLTRIAKLHKEAMEFDGKGQSNLGQLQPLDTYASIADASEQQKKTWGDLGFAAIAKGEVAALVLAGGAGSRLGFALPKGLYSVKLPSDKSLFQLFAERLRMLSFLAAQSGSTTAKPVPWYIMTSEGANHASTVDFFETNNYFGHGKPNVKFFSQGTLPCMTVEGKLMLETGFKVGAAADGNGGIYGALQSTGQIADMKTRGVKYVHVFSVDNAVCKVCDPVFMGYCVGAGADVGNKVVWKVEPDEKVGVIGKRDGKYTVIEYSEMSEVSARP
jgi:UDP-N-acetylglucosamine/UDP-N-acetylgalactosamine diphosphorylase